MQTYRCKLKTRKQIEKDIPRDRWGWWIDICAGKTLLLRKATEEDLKRCAFNKGHIPLVDNYMCEIGPSGSLVSKEAIAYVEKSPIDTEIGRVKNERR